MTKTIVSLILFTGFFLNARLIQAQTETPPRLSVTQALRWEVDRIVPESLSVRTAGDFIHLNNQYCPLSRTWIGAPVDRLAKSFPYKGRHKKFKGKTFVFNFCCTACRERFHRHFAKFPDEVLGKYFNAENAEHP